MAHRRRLWQHCVKVFLNSRDSSHTEIQLPATPVLHFSLHPFVTNNVRPFSYMVYLPACGSDNRFQFWGEKQIYEKSIIFFLPAWDLWDLLGRFPIITVVRKTHIISSRNAENPQNFIIIIIVKNTRNFRTNVEIDAESKATQTQWMEIMPILVIVGPLALPPFIRSVLIFIRRSTY